MEFLEWISEYVYTATHGGFWNFIGYWLLTIMVLGFPAGIINNIIKSIFRIGRPIK